MRVDGGESTPSLPSSDINIKMKWLWMVVKKTPFSIAFPKLFLGDVKVQILPIP